MKRTLLSTAVACLLLSSCATPNSSDPAEQAATNPGPGSTGQTERSDDGRLADIATIALERDLREREQAYTAERSGLMQKMQAMSAELAELKGKLQRAPAAAPASAAPPNDGLAAASATPARPQAQAMRTRGGKPVAAAAVSAARQAVAAARGERVEQAPAVQLASRETIVIQDKGMIFRVMHPFAHTEFRPSRSLQEQLLQAARAGKHIEIRGRTDAPAANDIDRDIAMRRALNARVFLANHGIHPRKMHIDYLAAGDHVADNRTAEGRARNRRVEIETAGMSPDVLEDLAAVIRQDLQ